MIEIHFGCFRNLAWSVANRQSSETYLSWKLQGPLKRNHLKKGKACLPTMTFLRVYVSFRGCIFSYHLCNFEEISVASKCSQGSHPNMYNLYHFPGAVFCLFFSSSCFSVVQPLLRIKGSMHWRGDLFILKGAPSESPLRVKLLHSADEGSKG